MQAIESQQVNEEQLADTKPAPVGKLPQHISRAEAKKLPIEGRCQFFLDKKRRYCRTIPPSSSSYCVEHAHINGETRDRKRIPCPLDAKHTIYEDQLKKHLKKCNSREKPKPVWFESGVNSDLERPEEKVFLREASEDEILKLISKVNSIVSAELPSIEREEVYHTLLVEEAKKPGLGPSALKHIKQQASLLSLLEMLGYLNPDTAYVEFGAGKGHMSHWIQQALAPNDAIDFVLVDRSASRYKFDVQHGSDRFLHGPKFERIRIDIEHLRLGLVPCLRQSERPVVGISKHLCGAATDLALRCLVEADKDFNVGADEPDCKKFKTLEDALLAPAASELTETAEVATSKTRVRCAVVALCCHHRCSWHSFCGKSFLQRHSLSSRDFALLTCLAGWATCGFDHGTVVGNDEHDAGSASASIEQKESLNQVSDKEKEEIGRRCKRLLDLGRLDFLRERGFDAKLVRYIDASITPENIALLVTRP